MLLSEAQRLTLKTNNAESRTYLSVYQPTTLMACLTNITGASVGMEDIPFDTVTEGEYGNVFEWSTVLVGTTPGDDDVGIIWARACTSTTLTVGLNSINWQNNLYLTVLNFVDIWNRPFSFYFSNDQIIYEIDGDTEFATKDIELGTFLTMGGNYAGFVGDQVYWDASGSENLAGNSVSYVWEFEGGDVSIHSGSIAGYVTYDTPGHYKTKVTGTASNGHVNVGYRYVSIYDKVGDNAPIESAEFTNFAGSRDAGGWEATCTILQEDASGIRRGYPTVVFARHNFGGTESDLFKILFSGYIIEKTGNYNHIAKRAEFIFGSGNEMLLLRPMTQVSVDDAVTAVGWYQVSGMTVKKFLYYYLNYFTTALACFDVRVRNGLDTPVKYFETDAQSIYENIDNIVNKTREASAVFDKYGTMWVEQNPSALDSYCSNVSGTFGLEDADYLGEVYIEENLGQDVGVLQLGGFVYNGTGSTQPVLSQSPDTAYIYYFGDYQDRQGFAIESQEELNSMAGNMFAHSNAKYPFVEINLFSLYLNFDIAPLQCIPISVSSEKNNLGISWSNKSFYCVETSLEILSEYLSILYKIGVHEVTQGFDAETLVIPQPVEENIDDGGYDPGDFPIFPEPNINFPPYVPTPVDPDSTEWCLTRGTATYGVIFDKHETYSSDEPPETKAYFPCNIRDTGSFPTVLRIQGVLFSFYGGEWHEDVTATADWYAVEAIDSGGNVLAVGSYTGDFGYKILGHYQFAVGGNVNIWGFRIRITDTENQEGYVIGTQLATGVVNGNSGTGAILKSDAVIGNYYSIASSGGPVYIRGDLLNWHYIGEVDFGSGWQTMAGWGNHAGDIYYGASAAYSYWYRMGNYSRVFFQALSSTIKFRAWDTIHGDNSGTLGYTLNESNIVSAHMIRLYGARVDNVCPVL